MVVNVLFFNNIQHRENQVVTFSRANEGGGFAVLRLNCPEETDYNLLNNDYELLILDV